METKEQMEARMAKARAARKFNTDKPTTPWRPAKKLDVPEDLKDPRFVYRFVNTRVEGNEIKKRQEGWEYDDAILAKMQERGLLPARRALNDGSPLGSTYTIRELVLMRIPKEMADARNEFYRERGNRARRQFQEAFAAANPDVATYGESKEEVEHKRM